MKSMTRTLLLGALMGGIVVWDVTAADAQTSYSKAGRLDYRNRCGWGDGVGYGVYLVNMRSSQMVVVTVRETVSGGASATREPRMTQTLTFQLQPAESRYIGCTAGDGIFAGNRGFSIIGERVIGDDYGSGGGYRAPNRPNRPEIGQPPKRIPNPRTVTRPLPPRRR